MAFYQHQHNSAARRKSPMCEKQIYRFDGKATETAIPEIDRKWLSSMMWHCLNKQRICPYRFTCQKDPEPQILAHADAAYEFKLYLFFLFSNAFSPPSRISQICCWIPCFAKIPSSTTPVSFSKGPSFSIEPER